MPRMAAADQALARCQSWDNERTRSQHHRVGRAADAVTAIHGGIEFDDIAQRPERANSVAVVIRNFSR